MMMDTDKDEETGTEIISLRDKKGRKLMKNNHQQESLNMNPHRR
jgi:hypothetical protein